MRGIYIVVEVGYDYECILGVFTSKRKAIKFAKNKFDESNIIEVRKYKANSNEFEIIKMFHPADKKVEEKYVEKMKEI